MARTRHAAAALGSKQLFLTHFNAQGSPMNPQYVFWGSTGIPNSGHPQQEIKD